MFRELFIGLIFTFYIIKKKEPKKTSMVKNKPASSSFIHSEEIRLQTLKTSYTLLQSLMNHKSEKFRAIILSINMRPFLAQYISTTLDMISMDKNRDIQLMGCKIIDQIFSCLTSFKLEGIKMLACFLPGICSSLLTVINGDTKTGYRVISKCIETLFNSIST
eukprot:UN29357